MQIWGLHLIDVGIIAFFLAVILTIGLIVSRSIKKESDFYLGGRKLGKALNFFLNFGNSTDSTGAVTLAASVYSRGAGGIWNAGFQTLFITPFFWFTQPWYRRARVTTMADLFVDRFDSRSLASAYAGFNIFVSLVLMGMGNVASYKVACAMVVKPESQYTADDSRQMAEYREYQSLKSQVSQNQIPLTDERFQQLDSMVKRGLLHSSITYVSPVPFYLAYGLIVGIYITLGGLRAAAITDALQGLLILVMSVVMIPMGLKAIGGFAGLHRAIPSEMFRASSDQNVFSIFAIFCGSMIQIVGLVHNMSTGGSAKDEDTARFGMISGGFTKRIVLIAWMLCGLLAIALLSGSLSDPDYAWGALSKKLLIPGLMGLMLSGMLLGHMPQVGVTAVAVSGLATRNLYEPIVRGKSERHYLRVGQLAIGGVLLLAIVFALANFDVVSFYKMQVTFGTFFGAAVILIFNWRRLTATSIMIGLAVWIVGVIAAPLILPASSWFAHRPALLLQTKPYSVESTVVASDADVSRGKAAHVGDVMHLRRTILPTPLFFDSIARDKPNDPTSLAGIGRFSTENYLLYSLGVPLENVSPATINGSSWIMDAFMPFVLLIGLSLVTPRTEVGRTDRFYAKMRTPVASTPEQDKEEVARSYDQPHRFDHVLLFPRSNWQFKKWKPRDFVGFFGCWAVVGLILLLLVNVLRIGR